MALAAVSVMTAGALAFTSCETFDDSALQGSIDDLNSRVEKLEDAVAQLQSEVDGISSLLEEGKIIKNVTSVENEDGTSTYTITYMDEADTPDKFTVGTPGDGNPTITLIEESDGTMYWGVVNEAGEADYILGEENKIAVKGTAPTLRVQDGKLQVSIDGTSWSDTGVAISDIYTPTFESVTPGDGKVTFTLQDGTSFEVPMTSELTCEFLSGKTWFESSQTKNLLVNAAGFDRYELSAPAGWEASFDGTVVSVTAPDTEYGDGNYAQSGEVVLRLYNTENKEVLMDKAAVQVGGNQNLSVKTGLAEDKSINIVVSMSSSSLEFHLGVIKASEFTAETAAEIANSRTNIVSIYEGDEIVENDDWSGTYTVPFMDFISEPATGEPYVIWFVMDQWGETIYPEDIQTYIYNYGYTVDAQVTNVTFNDADITVTSGESTEYFAGITTKGEFFAETITSMLGYNMYQTHTGTLTGKLSELNQETESGQDYAFMYNIVPGETYVLWTIIKNATGSYSADDMQTTEFTLEALQAGGSLEIEFGTVTAEYESISVPITRPAGAVLTYVMYISDEDYASVYNSSDASVIEALLGTNSLHEEMTVYYQGNLSAGKKGKVYAIVVDENGQYGPLTSVQADTKTIVKNQDITIEAGEHTVDGTSISIPLTISGSGAKSVVYYNFPTADYDYKYKNNVENIVAGVALDYGNTPMFLTVSEISSLSNNTLTIDGLSPNKEYLFVIFAIDEDGNVTEDYATFTYTSGSAE